MDIIAREREILSYWKENNTEETFRKFRAGGKKFYFLDGPPYVTGELGTHHIWVETIKDLVIRYRRYRGFAVHDRAGFDVHGLPIEFKVEKIVGAASKSDIEHRIGIDAFVTECRRYAEQQAESAISTFVRFGSSLDFKNVYMPYRTEYIEKGWHIFKGMNDKGLLYRELQPLSYCPRCETVLSAQGPEVEYSDETDPSVFVKFKIDLQKSKKAKIKLQKDTYLVVWTTTPWTLPANVAIAANPKEVYVCVSSENSNYIVAKARLEYFTEAANMSSVVVGEFYGSELDGIRFTSPLKNEIPMQSDIAKYHRVILSDSFVSVSEGTGLLHVAPGHGLEDYRLGKQNKLPIVSPVDQHAKFTEEAGSFKGLAIPKEANEQVIETLKQNGALMFQGTIRHSYPHCWRCHSRLITRSTEQWFIDVGKIKKRMLNQNKKVVWHPEDASAWFADAVESSPDWCISRQRYWGAPIPIWSCDSCKKIEVFGSLKELMARAALRTEPTDLHRPYVDRIKYKCDSCSGEMVRVPDIFDVWYDSGISHTASLKDGEFERLFPADWITESRDQIRGWFSMLLRTGVAVYGKTPFKRVNIGGMLKDELGQDMHRHLGNAVNANQLLDIVSADGFRLWCSSHPRWLELKLKKVELEEADRNIMTIYNISQLVREIGLLAGVDIKEVVRPPSPAKLEPEERWILSKLNTLIGSATEKLDDYKVDEAVNEIKQFLLEDLSRFYLKFAKQSTEGAGKSKLARIAKINAYIMRNVIILASPIVPFTSEYIYQQLFSKDKASIFLEDWPRQSKRYIDKETEERVDIAKEAITAILASREKNNVKLRSPILSATITTKDDRVIEALQKTSMLIESYTNARELKIVKGAASGKDIKPLFAKLGPVFKEKAGMIAEELKASDASAVEQEIMASGKFSLRTSNGVFEIKPDQIVITEKQNSDSASSFKHGIVSIDATQTDDIREELLVREVTRRVQMMRKDAGLTKADTIELAIVTDSKIIEILKTHTAEIKDVTRSGKVRFSAELIDQEGFGWKEWKLLDSDFNIGIKKI